MSFTTYTAQPTTMLVHPAASYPTTVLRLARTFVFDASNQEDYPYLWWNHPTVRRIACNSGEPISPAFAAEYSAVTAKIERLARDEEAAIPRPAIDGALHFAGLALFSGLTAPKVSWHSQSAVVLYWVAGRRLTFFTFEEDGKLSVLQEEDRQFVLRKDDIDRISWDRFLP